METLTLNNGLKIPAIGFGSYKAELESIVKAIREGYIYFDTASYYGTERYIADALVCWALSAEKSSLRRKFGNLTWATKIPLCHFKRRSKISGLIMLM